jgi:hypothetical protein
MMPTQAGSAPTEATGLLEICVLEDKARPALSIQMRLYRNASFLQRGIVLSAIGSLFTGKFLEHVLSIRVPGIQLKRLLIILDGQFLVPVLHERLAEPVVNVPR